MSGWFGTGNPELNDPFYGIEAGYRGRRNHQKNRYKTMGSGHTHDARRGSVSRSNRAAAATDSQNYLGYELVTNYIDPLRTYSTKVKKGGITRKTTQGSSKGQAVNAAKNWVDSQVVTQVDPSIQKAVKAAEQKATQVATKVVKQETQAKKMQAFREAEAASVKAKRVEKKTEAQKKQAFRQAEAASMQANKVAKAPAATQQDKMRAFREAEAASVRANQVKQQSQAEKMRAFREAEAASVAAQKKVQQAQASEAARFARVKEAQQQKILNEEMAKRSMFTESSVSPAKMMPNTSATELAVQNRKATLNQMRTQFKPVQLPKDFIAGNYTVRAVYNPTLKNYVVSVREGNIALESKTYGMMEGDAAKNKFNTFKSLVTKKAKYDGEVSKVDSKGNYDIELQVIQASLDNVAGGFLSGLMDMFGLGRGHSGSSRRSMVSSRAMSRGSGSRPIYTGQRPPSPTGRRPIYTGQKPKPGQPGPSPSPMSRPVPSPTGPDPSIMRRIEEAKKQASKRPSPTPTGPDASIMRRIEQAKKAAETPSMVPQAVRSRTQSMATKQVIPSGPDASITRKIEAAKKASVLKANWDKMPAKKFKVVVKRKDGSIAKETAEMGDYTKAVEVYESELLTVANNPDFYDKSQVIIPEAPVADGDGGDITMMMESSTPVSENYDMMVDAAPAPAPVVVPAPAPAPVVVPAPAPAQTYPQPVTTYQTTALPDNEYVIRQQSERDTAVAIEKNNTNLLLGAAALAGAVYLARK